MIAWVCCMIHSSVALRCGLFALVWWLPPAAASDEFDLYTNSIIAKSISTDAVTLVEKLSVTELLKAKPIIAREKGCLLIVRTGDGNWAKLIATLSFRRHEEGEVPLVMIQRFQCMRPGTEQGRLAGGKDVYLFDNFQFDLDVGQMVPDGGGGDIGFQRQDTAGFLRPLGRAKLYLVNRQLVDPAVRRTGPSAGPVVAEDFARKYQLIASGKWSGQLTLSVSNAGDVNGSYVSDQTGADYPVKGFVSRPGHHIKFTVELPMAQQDFDGYLWTQGKNAIAGTMTIAGSTFGFVAVRDGSGLSPKEDK
jgi:hypothetical protein